MSETGPTPGPPPRSTGEVPGPDGAAAKLKAILRIGAFRRLAFAIGGIYLVLFLVALQDVSWGGRGIAFLTTDWTRMFERTGPLTFEPVAQITMPGLTVLLSPLNLGIGLGLSVLAGLNLTVTWLALRRPAACRFNRSVGVLGAVPALLAGSACCVPAVVLLLGIQVSSLFMAVFQILLPVSAALLVLTLKLILDRTDVEALVRPAVAPRFLDTSGSAG